MRNTVLEKHFTERVSKSEIIFKLHVCIFPSELLLTFPLRLSSSHWWNTASFCFYFNVWKAIQLYNSVCSFQNMFYSGLLVKLKLRPVHYSQHTLRKSEKDNNTQCYYFTKSRSKERHRIIRICFDKETGIFERDRVRIKVQHLSLVELI